MSKLPPGFAQSILNYEMQIEMNENMDIKSLHNLIELYTQGVGYYESVGNKKYLYFHKKLNNLLQKPNV